MSGQVLSQNECLCPCGNGRIYQVSQSDNCERGQPNLPIIDCVECSEKYDIKKITQFACNGEYYCVDKGYPPYCGAKYEGRYARGISAKDLQFTQYLVEGYSYEALREIIKILVFAGTYSKIADRGDGTSAREIIRIYKNYYNTQAITAIISEVKQAIDDYYHYEYRWDTLEIGKAQYREYEERMRGSSIKIEWVNGFAAI